MQYRFGNTEVTADLDKSYASGVLWVRACLKYVKKGGRKGMESAIINDTKGILVFNHLSNRRRLNLV